MIASLRNLRRLFQIARILARHDALSLLDDLRIAPSLSLFARIVSRRDRHERLRPGQRLAAALEELGPTFIKLGQALSTRSDLIGEEIAADLAHLRDHLPPFSGKTAMAIIERDLDRPIAELFVAFDEEPVAAASIAQVHRAVTIEGAEVAVKVLRPNVEKAFARDLDLFYWIADIFGRARPDLRRLKPKEAIRVFEETVEMEMDLRFEAAAAAEMGDNFEGDPEFRIPKVDWQRTARHVLTVEWVDGIKINKRDALIAAGHDPHALMRKAANAFFRQVFRDGFFHGDLHPGNLFVDANGMIVAVDFGIMGRLDRDTRRYLGEMLLGFLTRDYRRVAEVHFEAGYVPRHKNMDTFMQAARSIAEPILGRPLNEISIARLLAQLFQVTETFEMEAQPQLLLLQKTMLVAEGVGRGLDPSVNMWQLAQPLIEDWVRDTLGPEARVRDAMAGTVEVLARLPRLVSEIEEAARSLSREGIRLHPDARRDLALAKSERSSVVPTPVWLVAMILLAIVAFLS